MSLRESAEEFSKVLREANRLADEFTSTSKKFFLHQEAMQGLREGQGRPIVTHVMLTDLCQHDCGFCSVAKRDGNALTMAQVRGYLDQLVPLGLKSVILSGGGNPILYRCPETHTNINHAVEMIRGMGLQIGLITNGMPLKKYPVWDGPDRTSWVNVWTSTLDDLAWVRISMSGLDHPERCVYVPDIDQSKTTLGFSYVYHDGSPPLEWLTEQIREYVANYQPTYVRLLPDCLQPELLSYRCADLQAMADAIDPEVCFVQYKPPRAPHACYLGYVHPVLNSDGWVFPCDSCTLNKSAAHKFAEPWRVCRWDEIGEFYQRPVRSLVDPQKLCPGCVFNASNTLLESVVNGAETPLPTGSFTHPNFP